MKGRDGMQLPRAAATILIALAACCALILIFGKTPAAALQSLFLGSFTSAYNFGSMLSTASFLMLAGTGSAISIKSGNMNLGGEGQVYLGGFTTCLALNALRLPPPLAIPAAMLLSAASGATMAGVSAFLKEKRAARPLLTSFLVSAAAIPIIDGLIMSSGSASMTNLLALPYIAETYRLPQILPPSPLSLSFFVAIAVCLVAWHVMFRSGYGARMQVWGTAPTFARFAGYNPAANSYSSLAISGALHALTGFFAVTGCYYTCHKGFYANMGWNALNVALISGSNPLTAIPVSLLLAWIFTSASRVSLTQGFDFDIAGIVQGIILFSVSLTYIKGIRNKKGGRK
ncbi:MAG: ABC transporter permease [Treponema sp.]|nr:ABC transporter permease [Treponema sp.]